jgi:hypothetical protein
MSSEFEDLWKKKEEANDAFHKELANASPERKREMWKNTAFASFVSKHRANIKIHYGGNNET